jgi:glycosyltransferase involved in cell wall biosynthesis
MHNAAKTYLHAKPGLLKTLYFTVTNDLSYDQRMIRICTTLSEAGFLVVLIGRKMKDSPSLIKRAFAQKRLYCFFTKGKAFYIEFNIRLFFWLLFKKMDLVCAIDLDTIMPCYVVSRIKQIPRVYDAHELFSEMKEVVTRPGIYRIWKSVERFAIPRFSAGYTVSSQIADFLKQEYGVSYPVIRNIARYRKLQLKTKNEKVILYQGAVNEGRYFEHLIPAMKWINAPLHIYGDGNFMEQVKVLISLHGLQHKVFLKGKRQPEELQRITESAYIGVTLFEKSGMSNYFSLSNRFFDYIQAGLPQLCSDYPAYREIINLYDIAVPISDHSPVNIARELNNLLDNEVLYNRLQFNCLSAAKNLNWENEEKLLLSFYQKIVK